MSPSLYRRVTLFSRDIYMVSKAASLAPRHARSFSATAAVSARISDAIKHDHRELEDAYHNINKATTTEDKVRWRNQFTWELARHSVSEELLVYPKIEALVSNGEYLADRDREEHLTVKRYLKDFQYMSPEDKEFNETLSTLWKNLKQHMEQEEHKDLVALEDRMSAAESEEMAKSFERTKMFTPTHSHPGAPDRPPFETVAGLMAAPLDRLRDLFRKFPHQGPGAGASPPPA